MCNIAIVVPVHNRLEYTKNFIGSLKNNSYKKWVLFIVDDGSTDGTGDWLTGIARMITDESRVELLSCSIYFVKGDGQWWWTKSINEVLRIALKSGFDYILTQNNDVELPDNYLERIYEACTVFPDSIITAPIFDLNTRHCLPDGGGVLRNWWAAKDIKLPVLDIKDIELAVDGNGNRFRKLTHCGGRGCLIPRQVFEKIGMYDEVIFPQYAADDDLTYRASSYGYQIVMTLATLCYTPSEETGLTNFTEKISVVNFFRYLTHQKSPANIKRRFWLTFRHCSPRWYMPISMLLDMTRVCVSYWLRIFK